ncbi:MAG: glycosyltransferase [Thermoguttaceae bacterium]
MIPKTIHFCWFGGKPYSPLIVSCLETWNSALPDWTFKRWDETNSPLDACKYVGDAFEHKQWAFVSDYVRLCALHRYGGVYLDTDMWLMKPLDIFLNHECFLGFESKKLVNGAIIGAIPQHNFIAECVEYYHNHIFLPKKTTTIPKVITGLLHKRGLTQMNVRQQVGGVELYPLEYFYPLPYSIKERPANFLDAQTPNTHAIHLWDFSWKCETEFLKRGEYEVGFPLVFAKLRKDPFQSFRFYKRVIFHGVKYLCYLLHQKVFR